MCICVNCKHLDNCTIYHAVETQHQQPHITHHPDFKPNEPSININISSTGDFIEVEWDVSDCLSFQEERGKWSTLHPGKPVPT